MNEADVALNLRKYFISQGWEILAFDFPQSGTGTVIHPNFSNEKNKDSIIPDLVAKKGNKGVLLENKDRFYKDDFDKINILRTSNPYVQGLSQLFGGSIPDNMWYGIGIPDIERHKEKSLNHSNLIDILFTVKENGEIFIPFSDPTFVF